MATRIARSIAGRSVIGAHPASSSDLSGIVSLGCVVGMDRIKPGLKLPASATNKRRQFVRVKAEERQQLAHGEFIEVEKSERAPLRLWRGGNPNRELGGVKLLDLGRRTRRNVRFLQHSRFGLNALLTEGDAAVARAAKKPEAIGGRFIFRRARGSITNRILEGLFRLARIARHEKAKTVKLRKIFRGNGHCDS